jgi:hypothetical protein
MLPPEQEVTVKKFATVIAKAQEVFEDKKFYMSDIIKDYTKPGNTTRSETAIINAAIDVADAENAVSILKEHQQNMDKQGGTRKSIRRKRRKTNRRKTNRRK